MINHLKSYFDENIKCKCDEPCEDPNTKLIYPLLIYIDDGLFSALAGFNQNLLSVVESPIFTIEKVRNNCIVLKVIQIIPHTIFDRVLPPGELLELYLAGNASLAPTEFCITLELNDILGFQFLDPTCVRKILQEIQINNYYFTSLTNDTLTGQLQVDNPPNTSDKAIIHYTVSQGPQNGTVILDELTGQFTYTPNNDYAGMDFFKVMVWNGYGEQKENVVSIHVNGKPIVRDKIHHVIQNKQIDGEVYAIDPLGTQLTYSVSTAPQHGTVNFPNINNPQFTYTPNDPAFTGADLFVVDVTNQLGHVSQETIMVQLNTVNSGPTVGVVPEEFKLLLNHTLQYEIKVADSGSDTYTYDINHHSSIIGSISNINISPDTKTATFDYQGIGLGMDIIEISVNNQTSGKTTHIINDIDVMVDQNVQNITPLNDNILPPKQTTKGKLLVYFENDGQYKFNKGRFYHTEKGAYVKIEPILDSAEQPFITSPAGQEYEWTYLSNLRTKDEQVNSGITLSTGDVQSLIYDITVSRAPVIISQTNTEKCVMNGDITGKIMAMDPFNTGLTFTVLKNPKHGQVTHLDNDGYYTYEPDTNFVGSDKFVISVQNSKSSVQVPINIEVLNSNVAPVIFDYQPNPAITFLNFTLAGQVFVSFDPSYPITYSLSIPPSNGNVNLHTDGLWEYTPNDGYLGDDQFEITVENTLGQKDSILIPVVVSTKTMAPVIYASIHLPIETYNDTETSFMMKAMNPMNFLTTVPMTQQLNYSIPAQATKGTASVDTDGRVTYTPDGMSTGIDMFEVQVDNELGMKNTMMVFVDVLNQSNPY